MNYHIKFDVYESLKECQYFGCLRSNEKNSSAISVQNLQMLIFILMSVLRDLVPFAQFKCEKHPWRSVTFIKVAGFPTSECGKVCNFTKSNTPPWVVFTFFKLYKW